MEEYSETCPESGKTKISQITESTSALEDGDSVNESSKNKKIKFNQPVRNMKMSLAQYKKLTSSSSTSLADAIKLNTKILETLVSLTTSVKTIHDDISELKKKIDSLVKNRNVSDNDEILFLEDYWPWKDESQMKVAETRMADDISDFNRTIMMLKRIGGHDSKSVIYNILKTTIIDEVAVMYSWAGKKKKKSFSGAFPTFVKVISVVSRYHNKDVTDQTIKVVVSRWLKQAKIRILRARIKQSMTIDNQNSDGSEDSDVDIHMSY